VPLSLPLAPPSSAAGPEGSEVEAPVPRAAQPIAGAPAPPLRGGTGVQAAGPAPLAAVARSLPAGIRLRLFGRRAVAALIDLAIGAGLYLLGDVVLGQFVSFVVWFVYLWWGNATGGSAGKRLLGLRTRRIRDGQPPGLWVGLGRTLCYGISVSAFGIGFLIPLWEPSGRALHDDLSGTSVVRARVSSGPPPSPSP
jgi:uncharacterized RDD family membrane protein YckC